MLDHYTMQVIGHPSLEPHPEIVNDAEECEVEQIVNCKQCYRKLHYLVSGLGTTAYPRAGSQLEISRIFMN